MMYVPQQEMSALADEATIMERGVQKGREMVSGLDQQELPVLLREAGSGRSARVRPGAIASTRTPPFGDPGEATQRTCRS